MFQNIPQVKLGIIAVSRDCFVISLSERRRKAIVESYAKKGGELYEVMTTVENENVPGSFQYYYALSDHSG